ncbi:hypothetical protein [Fibrella forsythiae]|uniref:Alpha/beta hydrolase n=1 Tax=Fibrella forsythiae TaxID=2817061 RepID=A0ABS3JLQ5_9BACT|nr:hypothetical protein [Fibrella forsythiae]MBO0950129.1 hypothetical protein [Fibrella forsythiae]
MPVVHIHGVATRNPTDLEQREAMLRRYITDELKQDNVPGDVPVRRVFWGDLGASFAWDLRACPTPLWTMGANVTPPPAEQAPMLAEFNTELKNLPGEVPPVVLAGPVATGSNLIIAGSTTGSVSTEPRTRLKDLLPDQLSELAVATVLAKETGNWQETLAIMAADDVARDRDTFIELAAQSDLDAELALLQQLIEDRYTFLEQTRTGLILQGPGWLGDLKDRVKEALTRADQSPGYALTRVLNQVRPKLNRGVMLFFGDVFTYLEGRGTPKQPGPIMQRLLDALLEARTLQQHRDGEPIVLLSHSMGGQIVYDALTHFLPNMPAFQDVKVDFWCATASQVGVFEEMKLFAESSPAYSLALGNKVPLPPAAHLGHWWNVWDPNDYLSYTAKPIFVDIDDEPYSSGMSVVQAHGGYLQQPSFYRKFAEKLRDHLAANWYRP